MVNTPQDKAFVIRTEQRDLCDPGTFLPIKVYYGYAENDDLLTLTANNADGTSYTGDISLLVTCTGSGGSGVNVNASQAGAWTVSVTQPVSVDDNGGSLTIDGSVGIIGTVPVSISGTIPVSGTVAVSSVAGTVTVAEPVSVDDNGGSLTVDGTVAATQSGAWATSVNNAGGASAVNIQDGGNSITVDGTVAISGTVPISAASLPLPLGASTAALQLPDGHNVTVDNAAGAAAVNIQDGGNSITVDGTVAATQSGVWSISTTASENSLMERLYEILSLLAIPDVLGRNRVNIEAGTLPAVTTVTTVTTVSTVTTVTTVGTVNTVRDIGSATASTYNAGKINWDLGDINEAISIRMNVRTF